MKRSHPRIALIVALGLAAFVVAVVPRLHFTVTSKEARQLVEQFNKEVCEAYRRSDITLIDSVVGMNTTEGNRLTGLIGVRQDMGITLDAQLLNLKIVGVEQTGAELHVRTQEQWRYRDLKIGSGQQVGEESSDSYEMLYIFQKMNGRWMAAETQFSAPPQVGRKETPWISDRATLHGMDTTSKEENKNTP